MGRHLIFLLVLLSLFVCTHHRSAAQVAESKIALLDSLPAAERQARLVEGARAEGEAIIYLNLDQVVASALTAGS